MNSPGSAPNEFASDSEWQQAIREGRSFLDVRAETEFSQGSIPGAINLPILDNEERHEVGTCYKLQGPEAATELGYRLVSGKTKDRRVHAWVHWLEKNPEALLYCFRGGQRSAIAQNWIRESGPTTRRIRRIRGGYKVVRRYLLETIDRASESASLHVIAGRTGSGKTRLLRSVSVSSPSAVPSAVPFAVIDLEGLARHRGSAFGGELDPQPSQADFENRLAANLMRTEGSIWIEDESRMIGRVLLPTNFFLRMSQAPVYVIEEPIEKRAKNILQEYVIDAYELRRKRSPDALTDLGSSLTDSVKRLSKRLGGVRTEQALKLVGSALNESRLTGDWSSHLPWIEFLLKEYYDPIYSKQLEAKSSRVVFRGSSKELRERMSSG